MKTQVTLEHVQHIAVRDPIAMSAAQQARLLRLTDFVSGIAAVEARGPAS